MKRKQMGFTHHYYIKMNWVCWIRDFRQINKSIKNKQYQLPIITKFFTILLDINCFQNFTYVFNTIHASFVQKVKTSAQLLSPFLNTSPLAFHITQVAREISLQALAMLVSMLMILMLYCHHGNMASNFACHHTKTSWHCFTIYQLKCIWSVEETTWLCYWHMPWGSKPWKKWLMLCSKCTRLMPTLNSMIIGCDDCYGIMWSGCAHNLKPFANQSLNINTHLIKYADWWHQMHLPLMPNNIYTDASTNHSWLGSCNMLEGSPVAY